MLTGVYLVDVNVTQFLKLLIGGLITRNVPIFTLPDTDTWTLRICWYQSIEVTQVDCSYWILATSALKNLLCCIWCSGSSRVLFRIYKFCGIESVNKRVLADTCFSTLGRNRGISDTCIRIKTSLQRTRSVRLQIKFLKQLYAIFFALMAPPYSRLTGATGGSRYRKHPQSHSAWSNSPTNPPCFYFVLSEANHGPRATATYEIFFLEVSVLWTLGDFILCRLFFLVD